ncbi:MAG: PorV/PorQ family protein [Melioribacteraceae bacterium]|nr:PorV/PorQ family protein [Melioribacteraceae bacterium]
MKKINYLFLIVLFTSSIFAQVGLNKLAQSTMNFQLVSISPKASSMGEAFYSIGVGSESVFYNPAGLSLTKHQYDVTLNYTQWIADINYLGGAVSYNLDNYGTVALSALTVDYGTIYGTQLDPLSSSPTGYIETGNVSNVGAYSFGLSYAKSINEKFSIGGNVRLVGQNLGTNTFVSGISKENKATKLVFDAGVLYNTGFKNFRFGMAIRNFSSNIKREEISEQLPLTFTMGGAIDVLKFINDNENDELTFAIDFLHSNSYSERINIGAEYKFLGMVSLRAGYQTNRDIASWSAGVGFYTILSDYNLEVNYSFSKMEIFNNVNRLSLNIGL